MAPSGLLFSDRGRKDLKAAVKMAHKGNVTARDAIADLNEMNGFYNTALAELAKVGSKDEQRDERYEEIRKKYNESKSNHEEIERVANKRFYIYNPSKHNNLQNTKLVFSKYSRAKTGVMKGYYPEKEKKPRKARGLPAAAIGQLLQNAPADEEPA